MFLFNSKVGINAGKFIIFDSEYVNYNIASNEKYGVRNEGRLFAAAAVADRSPKECHRMGECLFNDGDILAHRLGASGKIDDEGLFAYAADRARKHCVGRNVHRRATHRFGKTGRFAINHRARCLGCDIAWGKAGPAGGEYNVDGGIGIFYEALANFIQFIGNHRFCRNLITGFCCPRADFRSGEILALSFR